MILTTPEKKSPAKDRRKDKGKGKEAKKRWKEEDFDVTWEEELKQKIMSDTELYQRILRYEASISTMNDYTLSRPADVAISANRTQRF